MESTSLLKEVIDLILEWSPDLGIITSILSALLLVSAIMRTFFRVWNKTSLEKMLTPKYDAMWEDFLEHILLSLIMTLTIIGVGYALGENLNFSDNKTLALSLMIALFLILVKYAVMGVSILFPKVKRYIRRSYNLKQVDRKSVV